MCFHFVHIPLAPSPLWAPTLWHTSVQETITFHLLMAQGGRQPRLAIWSSPSGMLLWHFWLERLRWCSCVGGNHNSVQTIPFAQHEEDSIAGNGFTKQMTQDSALEWSQPHSLCWPFSLEISLHLPCCLSTCLSVDSLIVYILSYYSIHLWTSSIWFLFLHSLN